MTTRKYQFRYEKHFKLKVGLKEKYRKTNWISDRKFHLKKLPSKKTKLLILFIK